MRKAREIGSRSLLDDLNASSASDAAKESTRALIEEAFATKELEKEKENEAKREKQRKEQLEDALKTYDQILNRQQDLTQEAEDSINAYAKGKLETDALTEAISLAGDKWELLNDVLKDNLVNIVEQRREMERIAELAREITENNLDLQSLGSGLRAGRFGDAADAYNETYRRELGRPDTTEEQARERAEEAANRARYSLTLLSKLNSLPMQLET